MADRFPLFLTITAVLAFGSTWFLMDSPEPQPVVVAASPQQAASGQSEFVYFKNCDEVRAAGRAPLMAGRPGYNSELDPDGTGVACPPV